MWSATSCSLVLTASHAGIGLWFRPVLVLELQATWCWALTFSPSYEVLGAISAVVHLWCSLAAAFGQALPVTLCSCFHTWVFTAALPVGFWQTWPYFLSLTHSDRTDVTKDVLPVRAGSGSADVRFCQQTSAPGVHHRVGSAQMCLSSGSWVFQVNPFGFSLLFKLGLILNSSLLVLFSGSALLMKGEELSSSVLVWTISSTFENVIMWPLTRKSGAVPRWDQNQVYTL